MVVLDNLKVNSITPTVEKSLYHRVNYYLVAQFVDYDIIQKYRGLSITYVLFYININTIYVKNLAYLQIRSSY